ncbi:anti-sigma factor [Sulfitobacter noctilucae]|uniref:anti-sigma factor n=1 Tax=Sulfitobacter noctilucae TaxID=1342302 RepID=UPI000469AA0B|nr:anti-sigma factor [Sulfitobacter noctilucae]
MSDETLPPRDEDDLQAAEYALGVAEDSALDAARDRTRFDAAFAQRVAGWQERFVVMAEGIDPVTPPKKVKRAILSALFPKMRVPLMQRLWVWQGIALAAMALAAYLAAPLLQPAPDTVPRDVYATYMAGDVDDLELIAVVDTTGDIALRRVSGQAPEGRVLQLWAVLPDTAPISLGVLPSDETTRVRLPQALQAQIGVMTLAVSDEPPGGAPGAAPTGAIRAAGAINEL